MKKNKFICCLFIVALSVLSVPAFAFAAASITTADIAAWEVAGGYGLTSEWTADGARVTLSGAESVGDSEAWWQSVTINNASARLKSVMSITEGKTASVKFRLGLTDAGSTSVNGPESGTVDIDVVGLTAADLEAPVARLRIHFASWGWNNGNHPLEILDGSYNPIYTPPDGANLWLNGDASLSSEIALSFSREDLFLADFNGDTNASGGLGGVKAALSALGGIADDCVGVRFKIGGNGGFTKDFAVIVTEINGQSLANVAGVFTDTVAPVIEPNGAETGMEKNTSYTIPAYAVDLLTAATDIVYEIDYGDIDASIYVVDPADPLSVKFTENGKYDITLKATDAAGNTGTKVFSFTVGEYVPPVFGGLTPAPISCEILQTIELPVPEIAAIFSYTLSAALYAADGTTLIASLAPDTSGKFKYTVPVDFPSGTYKIVYTAIDSMGSVDSDPISVAFTVREVYFSALFTKLGGEINQAGAPVGDYTSEGLRIRSEFFQADGSGTSSAAYGIGYESFRFHPKQAFDIKFIIPAAAYNLTDDNGRLEIVVYNPTVFDADTNPGGSLNANGTLDSRYASYGVWANTNSNVFIYNPGYEGNTWGDCCDIDNAGWLSGGVDGVSRQFHMAFDMDEYFKGEQVGGLAVADNAGKVKEAMDALIAKWGDVDELAVALRFFTWGTRGDYFETVITEINGQSFANTAGVLTEKKDPALFEGVIPEAGLLNAPAKFNIYAKDILSGAVLGLELTKPDGGKENVADASGYVLAPDLLGVYTLKFSITGASGNTLAKTYSFQARDKITEFDLTLTGEYASGLTMGASVTVLDVLDKTGIETLVIELLAPAGSRTTVTAGQSVTLFEAGIYKMVYTANDDAQPEPNTKSAEVQINIIDATDPVIEINGIPTSGVAGEEIVIPAITVIEQTDYEITVTLINPDGTREDIQATAASFRFTPAAAGIYKIEVKVKDSYDNDTTETYTITVADKAPNEGCKSAVSTEGVAAPLLMITILGALFAARRTKRRA
jgi:hypothetical protein